MADEFAPLPPLPNDGPTDADLASMRHAAKWAKTFEPSTEQLPRTGQSLALRARHRGDIESYAKAVEQQRAKAQEEQWKTDRNAANYVLRSRAMDMKDRLDRYSLKERDRKMENAEKSLDSLLTSRAAATAASEARRDRDIAEGRRKNDLNTAADKFRALAATSPHLSGTPEDDEFLLSAASAHPLAEDNATVRVMLGRARTAQAEREKTKATAAQRAEAERKAKEMGLIPSGITATGATTFDAPPAPPKVSDPELETLKSNLTFLLKEEGAESPRSRTLRQRIAARERVIGGGTAPAPPAPAPESVRPIFKDKNGNRAYKNPDGTFEPIE